MKRISIIILAALVPACIFAADISLPAPSAKSGMDLLTAINDRISFRDFNGKDIAPADLSTILWAGLGNRMKTPEAVTGASKTGTTVPYSFDTKYLNLYVLTANGAYLYDPDNNVLKEVTDQNIRPQITGENITSAYCILLFTAYSTNMPKPGKANINMFLSMAAATAGYAAQNIALTATAYKIGAIDMFNIDQKKVKSLLKLGDDEYPLFIMQMGYIK